MTVQSQRNRKYRQGKRARGECGESGCTELSGADYRCPDCAEAHRARLKAVYWARKEQIARAA